MKEPTVSQQLTLHWVPVVDAKGRPRLEAVWTSSLPAHSTPHAA